MSTFSSSDFNSVFTTLATSVKTELDLQFTERRIIGSEYANAYTQLMDTVLKLAYGDQLVQKNIDHVTTQTDAIGREIVIKELQSAKDLLLKDAELLLKDAQIESINKDLLTKTAQLESIYSDIILKQEQSTSTINLQSEQKADIVAKRQSSIDLTNAQAADITSKTQPSVDLMAAQEEVYVRQKEGFDDNAKQKLLEVQLNAWGLAFSSGMLTLVPDVIKNKNLTTLYADTISKYGISLTSTPETPVS